MRNVLALGLIVLDGLDGFCGWLSRCFRHLHSPPAAGCATANWSVIARETSSARLTQVTAPLGWSYRTGLASRRTSARIQGVFHFATWPDRIISAGNGSVSPGSSNSVGGRASPTPLSGAHPPD